MKPIIGITMGDPASIGPELCLRALADERLYEICSPIIVGDSCILERAKNIPGIPQLKIHSIQDVREASFSPGTLDLIDMHAATLEGSPIGQVSPEAGNAAFIYLELSSQVQQRIEENLKRGLPAEAFARSTVEFGNEGCYLSLAEVLHINRLGTVFTD